MKKMPDARKVLPRITSKIGSLNLIFQKQKWRPNNMTRLDPDSQILSETMSKWAVHRAPHCHEPLFQISLKLSKLLTDL